MHLLAYKVRQLSARAGAAPPGTPSVPCLAIQYPVGEPEIHLHGCHVPLGEDELKLVMRLLETPGRCVSWVEIELLIWLGQRNVHDRRRQLVRRLRKKLGAGLFVSTDHGLYVKREACEAV